MWLVRVEPVELLGRDDRMAFECHVCERTQIVLWSPMLYRPRNMEDLVPAWSPDDIKELKALADAGVSPARIATRLKRTMAAVRRAAKEHGVQLKPPYQVRESYGIGGRWVTNRASRPPQLVICWTRRWLRSRLYLLTNRVDFRRQRPSING